MESRAVFWRGALLALVMAVAAACTVVVDEPGPGPRPPRPGPEFCTREYDPVCGRRGPDQQTFANACLADQAGYRVIDRGQCRRDPRPQPGACTRATAIPVGNCASGCFPSDCTIEPSVRASRLTPSA